MLGFRLFGRGKGQMYRERCRGMGCSVVGDVERIRRVAISDNEAKRSVGGWAWAAAACMVRRIAIPEARGNPKLFENIAL